MTEGAEPEKSTVEREGTEELTPGEGDITENPVSQDTVEIVPHDSEELAEAESHSVQEAEAESQDVQKSVEPLVTSSSDEAPVAEVTDVEAVAGLHEFV